MYKAVGSETEALSVLRGEFSLSEPELYDLARSFLGLPRPHVLPSEEEVEAAEGSKKLPRSFPRMLGMVGYMRSGKDVVASYLQETYQGVERMAFSDVIIEECNDFLLHWGHRISEENKDDYRSFLQNWSMARRSEEEDYWSRALHEKVESALQTKQLVVITGVRLPADVRFVESFQGEMWRVLRPGGKKSLHANEAWIDQIVCEHTIYNNIEGDTAPLQQQIKERIDMYR